MQLFAYVSFFIYLCTGFDVRAAGEDKKEAPTTGVSASALPLGLEPRTP